MDTIVHINRTQQVLISSPRPVISTSQQTICGVPQGSVLGPLLFNIFVIELHNVAKYTHTYTYADDTQIIKSFAPEGVDTARREIEADLEEISQWTMEHGLKLNETKCAVLLVISTFHLQKLPGIDIKIGFHTIKSQNSIKNLGLVMGEKWNFEEHVLHKFCIAQYKLKQVYPSRYILP